MHEPGQFEIGVLTGAVVEDAVLAGSRSWMAQ